MDAKFERVDEQLAREIAELDRSCPGWREGSRVANAKRRLERGTPEEAVTAIFGQATTYAALSLLRGKLVARAGASR